MKQPYAPLFATIIALTQLCMGTAYAGTFDFSLGKHGPRFQHTMSNPVDHEYRWSSWAGKWVKGIKHDFSLLISNKNRDRDMLLGIGSQWMAPYQYTSRGQPLTIWPKMNLFLSNIERNDIIAFAGGGVLHYQPLPKHPYHLIAEAYYAPQLINFVKGKSLWLYDLRVKRALSEAKSIELYTGLRRIHINTDNGSRFRFEESFYVGFSHHF